MDDAVIEESKNFIDWMYLSDEGQEMVTGDLAFIPAQEGYNPEDITDPVSREIYEALLAEETAAMTHNQYPNGWFQDVLYPQFQEYLDSRQTWEEFEEATADGFKEMR